jgi:DNA gyrase/topoisomerase IV subunit A
MTMKQGNEKYIKTVDLLRKAKPVLDSAEDIEREVISKISSSAGLETRSFSLLDLLFGWTNIVWIRRSLIAVSVMLITLFVYQQSMIVRQLNWLTSQVISDQVKSVNHSQSGMVNRFKLLKISGNRIYYQNRTLSETEINILIQSFDELQNDYNNLRRIIEDDPELKKILEKKLVEQNYKKVKL